MRVIAILGICSIGLSGCASLGTSGAGADALRALVTDPRCAHHDEAEGITGAAGVPASLHFKVVRDCPAQTPAATATAATSAPPS